MKENHKRGLAKEGGGGGRITIGEGERPTCRGE